MKKVLISFLLCFSFVLSAEKLEFEAPVLGKLIEINGRLYDTFYYHMDGEPQYLLQKYDEIAIPHSVNLNSLHGLEFNGIRITDMISDVTFDHHNFRAFKINLDEFDRKNWIQVRNLLAKNGIEAWPVLTYHAADAPIVLDGTMNLVFTKYTTKEEQEKTLELYNLKVVEIDEDMNFYTVSLPIGSDPFAIANSLYEKQLVRWAQPNWLWRMIPLSTTPNDPYFSKQWHLTQINAPDAWDTETAENKDVRIAIVDTGVDLNHPDINVLKNLGKDYIGNLGGAPNTSGNGNDHEGVPHGTACAGLAAAKTNNGTGVSASCWGCPIIPIRLISDSWREYAGAGATLEALKYAVDNGAWVVSNSWGAQDVDKYGNCTNVPADNNSSQGVDYGRTNGRGGKGTIFLWAAGNSHCNTNKNSFLKDNDFLTISALSQSGSLESYSNYGAEIDISAGAGNNTTDITGNSYGYACSSYNCLGSLDSAGDYTSGMSGTSAATPVAAGAVALMLAANPNLDVSGAMNCIKLSARRPSTNCAEGGWTTQNDEWITGGSKEHSPCYGFGIVDANAMVVGAKNGTCGECVATSSIDGCYGNNYDKDDDCDGIVDNGCTDGNSKGRAADPCSVDSDCINTAATPKCITDGDWKDGYCSATCTKNNDCYNGNSSVECYQGQCIAKCSYNEVRSGYACISNKILPKGTETIASCGNDLKEEGEKCDGGYKSCKSIDDRFTGGIAYCNKNCTGYDTSTCEGGGGVLCGNNNVDNDEVCDGDTIPCKQLAGAPENGTAKCAANCLGWDKSGCYSGDDNPGDNNDNNSSDNNGGSNKENCGNGLLDVGEQCDDGNRMDGDGCSKYCMKENSSKSSGCSVTVF
ncbi:S8 family serine peptidase [bacterium]|nr:S8 family serine peptidase [bacterium]